MKFEYTFETLPNGLRVVSVPMATPALTALALVGVGSRYEEPKIGGISHFLEHMVFKGTAKYPTAMAIASAVDAVGASYNAFTSKEYTGFYVKVASQHASLALDILAEFLFKAKLSTPELERERGVIIEEINMYEDTPMRRVGDLFDQLLYKGHSLGQDVIGTKASVARVTREDFVRHKAAWYTPEKIVLAVAGDRELLKGKKVEALIKKRFGRTKSDRKEPDEGELFTLGVTRERLLLYEKKTEQVHFSLGVPALERGHPKRYVEAVLATLLGGNMSSRLFSEIRERRGLAYYVRTGIDVFHETGHLVTQAGVKTDKLEEAVAAVAREYHKISDDKKVDQKELGRGKEYLKGSLYLELEDSQEVAMQVADSLLLESRVRTPQEIVAGIEAVTVPQVTALAAELFTPAKLHLAVIGPDLSEAKLKKALSQGS